MNKTIVASLFAALALCGCSWFEKERKPEGPDEVALGDLVWAYGGVDGSRAELSGVRIGGLVVDTPNSMAFAWRVGMGEWGYAPKDPKAIACLFCKVDGKWRGGKFEWISTSRSYRDLENIRTGYSGWRKSDLGATEFAFVVLSGDGRRRSNVAKFSK